MRHSRRVAPTTLIEVIKAGYFQQVRFLVEHGACLDERDPERRTPLMLCAFIEPEAWGVGICRLLIENGAILYYRDKYGLNAFHYAVIYGRLELVKVYLKAIDFDLNGSDKSGNTALHYAVRAGNALAVKLISEAYAKYGLKFTKENNDGYSAAQEARRLNKHRCARIIDAAETQADAHSLEANVPLDLNGVADTECDTASCRSSRKSASRPRSSFVSHRSSRSSLYTASDYTFQRSISMHSDAAEPQKTRRERRRDAERDIPPNMKNEKQLIRCASASDIRNNPEFLFHNTPIDATFMGDVTAKKSGRVRSAFVRRNDVENDMAYRSNWRTEFGRLYAHYQFQCSPSYRDTALHPGADSESLPPLDKPLTPATSEHNIDDADRRKQRVKSGSISRQNTEEMLSAGKNKQSKQNARKMSQNVGHGGRMGTGDGSLESSSESINSSASSKRHSQADGKISKPVKDVAGRTSRAAHKVPSVNVEEAK